MQIKEITIGSIRGKIVDILPYIDRMVIWYASSPTFDLEKLKSLCTDIKENKVGFMRYKDIKTGKLRFNHLWKYKLELIQPTKDAIRYLSRKSVGRYMINYVELALDFTAKKQEDVGEIRRFFDSHWVKKWHGKQQIKRKGGEYSDPYPKWCDIGTAYYCERKSPLNYIIYSDRPSKVNTKPCCHLEIRLRSHAAVKRARLVIYEIFLERSFFRQFWKKHLQLYQTKDMEYIKKMSAKTLLKKEPDRTPRERKMLLRIWINILYIGGAIKAQNFFDRGKWFDARRRFLVKLPNDAFLPRKR